MGNTQTAGFAPERVFKAISPLCEKATPGVLGRAWQNLSANKLRTCRALPISPLEQFCASPTVQNVTTTRLSGSRQPANTCRGSSDETAGSLEPREGLRFSFLAAIWISQVLFCRNTAIAVLPGRTAELSQNSSATFTIQNGGLERTRRLSLLGTILSESSGRISGRIDARESREKIERKMSGRKMLHTLSARLSLVNQIRSLSGLVVQSVLV
ncbi:hypothetical protein R3P38DRAFT_2804557 [Favolaschia claudopus]|uniref:ATP synthase protein MI25 n=1 Tax=Favolaschia claudopus TaxID=2862362 RepID=A0AAV9ZQU3_9AGAR